MYRDIYFCHCPWALFLYHRWWNYYACRPFFPLRRKSSSKIWLEIVRLLTLKSIQYMITSYFPQNYKWESIRYVTRGNLNKQNTWCWDNHNRKRWSKCAHLLFFFFFCKSDNENYHIILLSFQLTLQCLCKFNSQWHKVLLGMSIFISF